MHDCVQNESHDQRVANKPSQIQMILSNCNGQLTACTLVRMKNLKGC